MNEQLLRETIRKEIRKQISEGKLTDLIIRLFFGKKIKKAAKELHDDPDIQASVQAVEYAVQNWMDAVKRREEFYASDETKQARAYAASLPSKRTKK